MYLIKEIKILEKKGFNHDDALSLVRELIDYGFSMDRSEYVDFRDEIECW